ncbi:T9SS type A sorting domain-containing protein [Ekhidna sp.]
MVARIVFLFILFIFSGFAYGQNLACGTPEPSLTQKQRLNQLVELEQSNDLVTLAASGVSEIAIIAHVIRQDDGTGGLSEEELQDALDNVNSFYLNANMSFFYLDIRYIDDNKYYDFVTGDESELTSEYNYDGVINIYFANSVSNGAGSFYCGYAYFPGGPDVILMNNGCTTNGSTLPHEIGHFFYLYHTHGTTNTGTTDEVVIRPGEESVGCIEPDCTPAPSNCDTNGDQLCDTEADPNVSGKVDGDCNYTDSEVDPNGDAFRPDPTNIMSYSTKPCRNLFTNGQYNRINSAYLNDRNYLLTDNVLAAFDVEDAEICEGELINFSDNSINAVSYSWTFEGGDPATSTEANPSVVYTTSGSYDVSLTVQDENDIANTKTFTELVSVRGEITSEVNTLSGSFEEESLQELVISGGTDTWQQTNVGSDGSKSAYVVLVFMKNGQEDYLVIDPLNSAVDKGFLLNIDYAYAPLNDNTEDRLEVVYRDPCGEWQSVWSKEGQDLATAPNEDQVFFFPSSNQWKSETIFFEVDESVDVAEIALKTTSDNGNSLFVDNYTIETFDTNFSISDIEVKDATCTDIEDGSIEIIVEGYGAFEYSLDGETFIESSIVSNLSPGTYNIVVRNVLNHEETMEVTVGYENQYPSKPVISESNGELSINLIEEQTVEWYINGILIPEVNSNSISVDESGNYSVKVSNGMCSITSDDYFFSKSGFFISDIKVTKSSCSDIADGSMSISVNKEGIYEYSIDGETYGESSVISNLSPGTYNVIVRNSSDSEETMEVTIGYENEYPAKPIISKSNGELSVLLSEGQTVEWYYEGELVLEETSGTISSDGNGLYSVRVSNGACSTMSDEFIVLGAEDDFRSLEVYPNPVQKILSVSLSNELKNRVKYLSISDLSGKVLVQLDYDENVNVESLESGLYFIHFELEGQKITRRFLKQ